jgi:hypothetical protein
MNSQVAHILNIEHQDRPKHPIGGLKMQQEQSPIVQSECSGIGSTSGHIRCLAAVPMDLQKIIREIEAAELAKANLQ